METVITQIKQTLDRLDRLLTRFKLDVASQLYPLNYGQAIAALCQDFERHMQVLAKNDTDETTSFPGNED